MEPQASKPFSFFSVLARRWREAREESRFAADLLRLISKSDEGKWNGSSTRIESNSEGAWIQSCGGVVSAVESLASRYGAVADRVMGGRILTCFLEGHSTTDKKDIDPEMIVKTTAAMAACYAGNADLLKLFLSKEAEPGSVSIPLNHALGGLAIRKMCAALDLPLPKSVGPLAMCALSESIECLHVCLEAIPGFDSDEASLILRSTKSQHVRSTILSKIEERQIRQATEPGRIPTLCRSPSL